MAIFMSENNADTLELANSEDRVEALLIVSLH